MPVDHAICIVAYNSVSKQLLASNCSVIMLGKIEFNLQNINHV